MIIDTHCHLADEMFEKDLERVIDVALQAEVRKMVLACCNTQEFAKILEISSAHPQAVFPTLGIHPEDMNENVEEQISVLEKLLREYHDRIIAIGEIGLDLYWDKSRLDEQKLLLHKQLCLALEYDLPVL